jgi:hypothetical protein
LDEKYKEVLQKYVDYEEQVEDLDNKRAVPSEGDHNGDGGFVHNDGNENYNNLDTNAKNEDNDDNEYMPNFEQDENFQDS